MNVSVGAAPGKGQGVFAAKHFGTGDLILEFESGPIVDRAGLGRLDAWEREHLAEVGVGLWRVLPEPRCYVNHACEPNAVSTASAVFALRDIAARDEITIDYRLNAYADPDPVVARCVCDPARGPHEFICDFFSLPDETQVRYLEWAPAFIKEMYAQRRA
ncbi:MAG TPA: SET domain-containing protein [Candidatus Limnocylindria bacterium]